MIHQKWWKRRTSATLLSQRVAGHHDKRELCDVAAGADINVIMTVGRWLAATRKRRSAAVGSVVELQV